MSLKRPLYKILNLSASATDEEVSRAYRRLALEYHPDRNPNGESKFKEIANAYSILSDPEKRHVYDATGIIPGSIDAEENNEVNMRQRSAEMKMRVQTFYASYAGSLEEVDDVISRYNKCQGNFRRMVREEVLFDNTKHGEIQRIRDLVQSLIEKKKLKPTEAWNVTSSPAVLKKIERSMAKERKEAAEIINAMGVSSEKQGSDFGELQALMKRDHEAQWSNMMNNLEAKYLKPRMGKNIKDNGKRKRSEVGSITTTNQKRKKP